MTDFPSISESNKNRLITNVIKFLQYEAELSIPEKKESIEIAIQCLESAYLIDSNVEYSPEEFKRFLVPFKDLSLEEKILEMAENYKSRGNDFMKNEKYADAVEQYNQAINLCSSNAVFYCNRAAAFTRLNKHRDAIKDCKQAVKLDCNYDKAYGRLGIAYSHLRMHAEARDAYKKALSLDPNNSTYTENLKFCESQLLETSPDNIFPTFNEFITNPSVLNVATELLHSTRVCDFVTGMLHVREENTAAEIDALLEVQRLVEQVRIENSEIGDSLGLGGESPNSSSRNEERRDDSSL